MRQNYVLIEYENVQPRNLKLLHGHDFKVMVFVGANQKNVPVELAEALQPLGGAGQYVRITGNGPNALDFHIAYYIGKLAAEEPKTHFHIISKDTGFDPLIKHLRARKILRAAREEPRDVPLVQIAGAATGQERIDGIVRNLKGRGTGRPKRVKTLKSTINSLFQKELNEKELTALVVQMQQQKLIRIDGGTVSYRPPIKQ